MCGISGIVTNGAKKYDVQINSMVQSLRHRGPDGEGVTFFDQCVLGHTRLSIIDLHTGDQPMYSASKKRAIVFNGEIYGFAAIRESLRKSYTFQTSSDTEVILALYETYGANFLQKLPGMFSFALWDDEKKQLVCARDRFGEKPFYYTIGNNGEFIFASEIKAIVATGLIRPVLSKDALVHYLKHLYVHPHRTIYKNIFTLPPAHQLIFKDGTISITRYWEQPKTNNSIGLGEAVGEFRNLFSGAVERQLVADVPVGAFLSGGLDSSTVVAVASHYARRIKTFSFGFEESINELPFAREVSKKYGTEHFELTDSADIADVLMSMQDVYDEPFGDSSNIPTFLMSKLAREHSTVVLTGDGGDELMGGYSWYGSYPHMGTVSKMPDVGVVHLLLKAISKTGSLHAKKRMHQYRALTDTRRYKTVSAAHAHANTYFSDSEIDLLGLGSYTDIGDQYSFTYSDTVDDAMRMDIENYMPGDILVKTDRASMAHALEFRAPFLDEKFAAFCISVPFHLKLSNDSDKYLLRKAYEDVWPPSIRKRKKQGFGAPVGKWLRRDSVRVLHKQYLQDPSKKIFKVISYPASRSMVGKDTYQTWALLVLSLWMETHDFDMIA